MCESCIPDDTLTHTHSPLGTNLAIASRHLAAETRPFSSSRYKNEATKPKINHRNDADLVESCLRRRLEAIEECSGVGGLLIRDKRRKMCGGMLAGGAIFNAMRGAIEIIG